MFREHAVGCPDDIGGNPISGPSSSRKPAMDDHVIISATIRAGSYFSDAGMLLTRLNRPSRPGGMCALC